MNKSEAIEILQQHNEWRRGDEDLEMQSPKKIGEAIDVAVTKLSKKITWPSLIFPPINLWSLPKQPEQKNVYLDTISKIEVAINVAERESFASEKSLKSLRFLKEKAIAEKKERDFIYYTRTGGFPKC